MPNKRHAPLRNPYRVRPVRDPNRKRPLPYLGAVLREDSAEYIALVEIDWAAATEYYSFTSVRSPSYDYLPYVTKVSPIRRSVALIGGAMSIGQVRVTMVNSPTGGDRVFSKKLASASWRGIKLRVKMVNIAEGYSSALTLFEGRLTRYEISSGTITFEARNSVYEEIFNAKLSQTVPVINRFNFTGLPTGQAPVLAPLVFGRLFDPWASTPENTGTCPAFLVDTSGGSYVYVVGARPLSTQSLTPTFYNYNASVAGTLSTAAYNGNTYATVTFGSDKRDTTRPDEMEITAFLNGINEDDVAATVPILNPVRMLEYLLDTYTSLSSSDFDSTLQTTAKNTAASQGYADDFSGWMSATGGVIFDINMSWREVIEKFCESCAMQFYMTRDGDLATFVDTDDADPTADFSVDDETDILADPPLRITSNDNVASVIQYNHAFRWTFGRRGDPLPGQYFERQPDYRIPGEKARIGGYDVRKSIALWYVRHAIPAAEVARVYADYFRSQSEWIEFNLPIRWFRWADLNRYVSITHWQGISAAGGYSSVTARIVGIEIDVQPRSAEIQLRCFKKPTFTAGSDTFTASDGNSIGSSWTESEDAATNLQILSNQMRMLLVAGAGATNAIALRTETFGDNHLARAKLASNVGGASTATFGGLCVRGSGTRSSFTGYVAIVRTGVSGVIELRKFSAAALSAGTLLQSATLIGDGARFADGDTLEIRADGTSIEVWNYSQVASRNGRILQATDSDITSGTPGFVFRSDGNGGVQATFDWDDFTARDF